MRPLPKCKQGYGRGILQAFDMHSVLSLSGSGVASGAAQEPMNGSCQRGHKLLHHARKETWQELASKELASKELASKDVCSLEIKKKRKEKPTPKGITLLV